MYIHLLVRHHLRPIWSPVLPLNLTYFEISSSTTLSEPALYILLTFQVPNLISIFFHLGRLSKESVQVRGFLWSFITSLFFTVSCQPHTQPPSWRTTPCRLCVTAYSIYLHLPSIPGGRLLHPQPETRHDVVTRDLPTMGQATDTIIKLKNHETD
jgi:hypothetical protein